MHAPAAKICDTCGSSLDLETPSGFCPACLLSAALNGSDEESNGAGASIADYEILSEIARGGMGIVYRARQRIPVRVVALKMILPTHISSPGAIARFRAEAEAAASLDHPGILPVYAVGEKDGAPFYSMKFAEGGSLAARLAAFRDKPRESANLIAKLARAVAHAHERGILHRDLKPGNVLFDGTDKPFVSDFGLAKWLEREGDLTQTLAILGTPHYMAPEQTAHAHSLTPAADIYSLGAILFHLLTGRVPFRGDNALDVLRQAAERPAPRPRALNRKIPPDLETICLKCLEKNPATRYSSAAALADDLDRFLARRAIFARRANPITHAVRWARRNPTIAALSAALLALLLSLFFVLRPTPKIVDLGKSIAVLPFENLSDDQTNASFADAIQNDVLTNLAKVADLKVISRASVMQYRDKAKSTREIGEALKVAHLLEGSVQKIGGRVRVSVQLIDTRSDAHIWAEQFDRDLADVFALQSELAEKIVSRLTATLSPREKASIETTPTRDLEAYNLYLRARELMFNAASAKDPKAEAAKAIELLDQAVARDPSFALAYSLLGRVHIDLYYNSGRQAAPHLAQARACVENALRLAPDSGEAHFANAFYLFHGVDDQTRALEEFAVATRELPNNADALSWMGILERRMGHWPEALRDLRRATELDPHNGRPPIDLIVCYEALRNYAEADLAIERALIAIPRLTNRFRARKAEIALLKGDTPACRAILESIPSDYEPNGTIPYLRSRMYLWNREYAEAARVLDAIPKEELKGFTRAWVARDQAFIACARDGPAKAEPVLLDAIDAWQAQLGGNSDEAEARSYIALWSAALGRKDEALRESQKAVDLRPLSRDATNAPSLLNRQALVHAWCGERELALKQLEALSKIPGGPSLGELRLNPAWDVLRDEPRFQAVVAAAAEPIRLN